MCQINLIKLIWPCISGYNQVVISNFENKLIFLIKSFFLHDQKVKTKI